MFGIELKARKLTWSEVSDALSRQISAILQESFSCRAVPDDETYWDIRCPRNRLRHIEFALQ